MTDVVLHTIPEAARLLSASPRHLWRLIAKAEIRVVRLGAAVRIPASEIARLSTPANADHAALVDSVTLVGG